MITPEARGKIQAVFHVFRFAAIIAKTGGPAPDLLKWGWVDGPAISVVIAGSLTNGPAIAKISCYPGRCWEWDFEEKAEVFI